ncbi:hypothetical protein H257_11175 [Aphanomyces astaci]|uniref:Uncharacterized protein n=1 Tax=Aphanomyces astaci TaxID=112090 RepID=W4G5B4_APHAT|nr:hypothetical protein H257_11175 [Aphanomyces astaci]ETV74224.1 hypothetical protein H257_11175 [Aphanomyces astaci]|eukprot:XP_009836330.1 hypothetical protein H257_11175 [Aphanomyces astaci]
MPVSNMAATSECLPRCRPLATTQAAWMALYSRTWCLAWVPVVGGYFEVFDDILKLLKHIQDGNLLREQSAIPLASEAATASASHTKLALGTYKMWFLKYKPLAATHLTLEERSGHSSRTI